MELNELIFKNQIAILESYDNKLNSNHKKGLQDLATEMETALDTPIGRKIWDIPTGGGKTSSVVALIKSLEETGSNKSIVIAQEKVEGLCSLYHELDKWDVPKEKIGLIHSKQFDKTKLDVNGKSTSPTHASLKRTPEADIPDKQYILLSHSFLRGKRDIADYWHRADGSKRDLLIYDETLFVTSHGHDDWETLCDEIAIALGKLDRSTHYKGSSYIALEAHLNHTYEVLKDGVVEASDKGESVTIELPKIETTYSSELTTMFGIQDRPIKRLIDFCTADKPTFRIEPNGKKHSIITYDTAIDAELDNILILDASSGIRYAARLNKTLKHRHANITFNYSNVTVRYANTPGGKSFVKKEFKKKAETNTMILEAIEIIRKIEPSEDNKVLIFAHKDQPGKLEIISQIRDSVNLKFPQYRNFIHWETFGNETASNEYSECKHVVLLGMLEKPAYVHQAMYVGEKEDIEADVVSDRVNAVKYGEILHTVYQAVSRGNLRRVQNGKAGEMTIWMLHNYCNKVKNEFEKARVLSGATWTPYKTKHMILNTLDADIEELVEDIKSLLIRRYYAETSISKRCIKGEMSGKYDALSKKRQPKLWTRACARLKEELPAHGWQVESYNFVKNRPNNVPCFYLSRSMPYCNSLSI